MINFVVYKNSWGKWYFLIIIIPNHIFIFTILPSSLHVFSLFFNRFNSLNFKWVVEKTNQGMRYWFKNIFKNNSSKIVYLQKGKQFLNILLNKIIFWNHKIPRIYHIQNFKIFLKLENNIISSQLVPIESFKSMVVEFSKVI